jgi:hypothetical protein
MLTAGERTRRVQ